MHILSFPFRIVSSACNLLLDFIYPAYCLKCQSELRNGHELICDSCFERLPIFPQTYNILLEITNKLNNDIYIDDVSSLWSFDTDFQIIAHQLKYRNKPKLGKKIAYYMLKQFNLKKRFGEIDLILPVPLHKKRKRQRGYNQSYQIVEALSVQLCIPHSDDLLKRKKNTVSQTQLNVNERMQNMENAFTIEDSQLIKGNNILLVDDVITTGSTINACAKQLKLHGAQKVFVISAAKA